MIVQSNDINKEMQGEFYLNRSLRGPQLDYLINYILFLCSRILNFDDTLLDPRRISPPLKKEWSPSKLPMWRSQPHPLLWAPQTVPTKSSLNSHLPQQRPCADFPMYICMWFFSTFLRVFICTVRGILHSTAFIGS